MTPPRPTAASAAARSAADLRREMVECLAVDVGSRAAASYGDDIDDLMAAVRAEALAHERERCAMELDELAQDADMAAYACLGGATADTEPGEVLDGEGLSIAAATACAYRDGAARIRALVSK